MNNFNLMFLVVDIILVIVAVALYWRDKKKKIYDEYREILAQRKTECCANCKYCGIAESMIQGQYKIYNPPCHFCKEFPWPRNNDSMFVPKEVQ